VIDKVAEIGSYLGPEIVLCAEAGANGEPNEPVVLAEVTNQGGLETFIRGQLATLGAEGKKASVQFVSDPAKLPAKASGDGLFIWMKDDVLAASPAPQSIARFAATLKNPEANKFASSPFRAQLAEIYRDGAGLLIAADLQKLVRTVAPKTAAGDSDELAAAERLGLLNVKYFIAELKEKDGRASNRAMLSFTERKGLASWLATPGPMGALEFISPDATAVAAFVAERPVAVVDDLLGALKTAKPEAYEQLKAFETEHGISIRDGFAAPLGGEFAFAIDGPLLPIPAWKAVIEVNDQVRMQQSIEQAISEINEQALAHEKKGLTIEHATSGDRVFHTIKALDAPGVEVCYTYAYGYLIAASSRSLVERAIQYHDSGVSLQQSAKFKSTLPEDKQANFSAMLYYNIGPAVTPLMKQGLPVPKKAAVLSLTKPTLAYIYSQGDSFTLSANTEDGPIGLTPSMLMGLPGGLGGLIK
jgi:hypothetical protein